MKSENIYSLKHLSVRVAWHDNKWNGTVCQNPIDNSYCLLLPRIYEEKNENLEDEQKGLEWNDKNVTLPPCKAESGGFMNEKTYLRTFTHPYSKSSETHKHLKPTPVEVQPFTTFAVPFWWMLNSNQKEIFEKYPDLPRDENAPFNTAWVFGEERQRALLKTFFSQLKKKHSLVLFYTKSGNPIDEEVRRLLVGIGSITDISGTLEYRASNDPKYPLWDTLISHSIRPDKLKDNSNGFLIPYHEYLQTSGNEKEDKKRVEMLNELKLSLIEPGSDESMIDQFSYGSQLVDNVKALDVLVKLTKTIKIIKEHGIISGPWDKRLDWINDQIGKIKASMGPFPGFGAALVSLGIKRGFLMAQDIYDKGWCTAKDNPWKIFEDILKGKKKITKELYAAELAEIKGIWEHLPKKSKELLILLSRFELTAKQMMKWYDSEKRIKAGFNISSEELISNPYLIAEEDLGDYWNYPISVTQIDQGVFEDKSIQGEFVPVKPYRVESDIDKRRIRALIIKLLRSWADEGDTLLSYSEVRERLSLLKLEKNIELPEGYLESNLDYIKEKLTVFNNGEIIALQLKLYEQIEDNLRKVFLARASKTLPSLSEDWEKLILTTLDDSNVKFDPNNKRHVEALQDQVKALEKITTRKLTILNGAAGTGKTTVLGALFRSNKLRKDNILLLAPTGKARVRLGNMANTEAFTLAQFLTRLKRFNWTLMKPMFEGKDKYRAERTVIIDECSMLTVEDFYALFQALDLNHVQRIILVGDPSQLPPIGPGRPFADLCAYLSNNQGDKAQITEVSDALARLEEIVRSKKGKDSDTLQLASWFSGIKPSKNSDEIFDKLSDNALLNDLRVESWKDPDELEKTLKTVLVEELELADENDIAGFNRALGFIDSKFDSSKPESVENFQLLSPVKNPAWGTNRLNRMIQKHFRKFDIKYWERPLGDQNIWREDKVIQLVNEKREGYIHSSQEKKEIQLSNGQIGIVVSTFKGYINASFAGVPNYTFGYNSRDFSEDSSKIELAYSITIHKSQGSDFQKVFLILPKKGRILSRELLYTALTRSKDKLVLLIEGENPLWIFNYSKPQASETAKRNSHLFITSIREKRNSIPFAEGLIHKTEVENLFVRSKSEVIISNMLFREGVEFYYERKYDSPIDKRYRYPDFTFIDPSGELIILEHLGMLNKPSYKEDWEKKKSFYKANGFKENENLFTTQDEDNGAIDSDKIKNVIQSIKKLL